MPSEKISQHTAAASATTTMQVPVNDSGTNKRVTLAQVQTLMGIPFTHSTSEQVWPFEKHDDGKTIYCQTWNVTDEEVSAGKVLLLESYYETITNARWRYNATTIDGVPTVAYPSLSLVENLSVLYLAIVGMANKYNNSVTLWYTKP